MAIFYGPSLREWGPSSLWTGLGGSEEAVVHLAYRLRDCGLGVTVYNSILPADEGVVAGVTWRRWQHFDEEPQVAVDVFIACRDCDALWDATLASLLYCWQQDTDLRDKEDGWKLADGLLFVSEWQRDRNGAHRRQAEARGQAAFLLRNAIDPALLPGPSVGVAEHNTAGSGSGKSRASRAVWASSPERGLNELLEVWPLIKERVPNASLDVYFRPPWWEMQRNSDYPFGEEVMRRIRSQLAQLTHTHDVRFHGMAGHLELAHVFAEAGAWLYPTWKSDQPETACITAIKAMAAGAYPVTTGHGGMPEYIGRWERGVSCSGNGRWDSPGVRRGKDGGDPGSVSDSIIRTLFVEQAVRVLSAIEDDADRQQRWRMSQDVRTRWAWAAQARSLVRLFALHSKGPRIVPTAPIGGLLSAAAGRRLASLHDAGCAHAPGAALVQLGGASSPDEMRRSARLFARCDARKTWAKAQAVCERFGGWLATPNGLSERRAVFRALQGQEGWIGLRRTPSGNFAFVRSSAAAGRKAAELETDWDSAEPSNDGDCVVMDARRHGRRGRWNDYSCDLPMPFVCEWGGSFLTSL